MDYIPFVVAQVAIPVIAGAIVLALATRSPGLADHPVRTALGLYVLLFVLTGLAAPGAAMWVPLVGGLVSVPVAIVVWLILRHRWSAGDNQARAAG